MFHKGDFYPRRDGSPSPYLVGSLKDITDANTAIRLMKILNYPFIAKDWYQYIDTGHPNPIGKYIMLMNLATFKCYCFSDSKSFNNYSQQELKRLFHEAEQELYYEVADILPELEIKTEEIKRNTLKKPKYLITYDENDNPIAKFKYINDMNTTCDYYTTSAQNAQGHPIFNWTSDKIFNTNFTCDEIELFSSEDKSQDIAVNEYNNSVPKVKEIIDFTKEVDSFIESLKGK